MALTAAQAIALALESAHSPGKATQALLTYNSILSNLCQTYDFAEARGQFVFTFAPNTGPPIIASNFTMVGSTTGAMWGSAVWGQSFWGSTTSSSLGPQVAGGFYPSYPGNQFGSGPYVLPLDYLRLSGSSGSSGSQKSFMWWLNGVSYPVIPMDLAEFDLQVQQTGLQSFVWLSATDMSTPIDDRILLTTTGNTTAGSSEVTGVAAIDRLIGGNVLGVAGQGILPGTMLEAVFPAGGGGLVPGGGTSGGGGLSLGGGGLSLGGGGGLTPGGGGGLTPGGTLPGGTLALSQPANATITGASLMFGYCPLVYIYPPPQSALQAMIRYQRRMPDVFDTSRYPWFHNDEYMLDKLTGRLCRLNDDDRADRLLAGPDIPGSPDSQLRLWLAGKDDDQSHPKRVELDRRAFGRGWIGSTKITKRVGW